MSESTEKTVAQFIAEHGLEIKAVSLGRSVEDKWESDSWSVTIHKGTREQYDPNHTSILLQYRTVYTAPMTVTYRMGIGHKGKKPTLEDVIDSLRSDAECVEGMDPFEFMSELGFDNPRKTRTVYNACLKIRDDLKQLLGESGYRDLLDNVERL